jgi:CRP-like cAMP-binding protein
MINELSHKNNGASKNTVSNFSSVKSFNTVFVREKKAEALTAEKISNNLILGSLSNFDAARLVPHLDFVFLASGEEIYATDEPNRYVYFPETAVVSDISDLEDGNTIETAMIGHDGASGLCAVLGTNPPLHRAKTTIKGTAWRIKTETLRQEFARGGTLQTRLLDYVNLHINQISQRLVCKSFHLLEKRLCNWLLMLHDRVKTNRLKMTQERAALLLGANRPTITIAAQMLRQKGFIDYSRGGIKILDRRGLEDSACECYSALQLNECGQSLL